MERARKEEVVAELKSELSDAGVVVVAHYSGLTVADMSTLRNSAREAGVRVRVAKNRLVKLALQGTESSGISDLFSGPTVIAWSDDPVAAPKVAADFAKENDKLVILGGTMGSTVLDTAGVSALASLPSLDELRAKLLAMVNTPATRIAGVLAAPAGQVARVLNAYATKSEAA